MTRVQLDERGGVNPEYVDAPAIDTNDLLEIENIEGRTAARRRKTRLAWCRPSPSENPGAG